jgi:predicted nucleotide-binding protein
LVKSLSEFNCAYKDKKMQKEKLYANTRFGAEVLREAVDALLRLAILEPKEEVRMLLSVEHDDSEWTYDSLEEFLADYRRFSGFAYLTMYAKHFELRCVTRKSSVTVVVKAKNRADIEKIFNVFERHAVVSRLEPVNQPARSRPVIFIGHGRSSVWRDLKDHLHDKHEFEIESFETGARAGHTIRDILDEMVGKSTFALIVLTGEDEQADGRLRARQNVIHEAGLFQGRLGFPRAILLIEDGLEEFSNVHGLQHIKFGKDNIKETFGEVLATLRREFGD